MMRKDDDYDLIIAMLFLPKVGIASSTTARVCRCLRDVYPRTNVAPMPRCGWQGPTLRGGRASSPAECVATGRRTAVPSAPPPSRSRSVAATTLSTSSPSPHPVTWLTVQVLNKSVEGFSFATLNSSAGISKT